MEPMEPARVELMDAHEIQNYFGLEQQEMEVLGSCIKGYGQSNPVGQLFYRACEWVKSLFGTSEWQQAVKILKSREYRKLTTDAGVDVSSGTRERDEKLKKSIKMIAKTFSESALNHQIALKCNFSLIFSPISFDRWASEDWGNLHLQPIHDRMVARLQQERQREREIPG
jgi:hypothetical protein